MGDPDVRIHLHDVETLNRAALAGRYDVTKLSMHAYLLVRGQYRMLRAGAAVGHRCGPVVVSARPIAPDELSRCRVAIPGRLTTAHLLLRLWAPNAGDRVFERYDRIADIVARGDADVGVLIHEGRFVYEQAGLQMLADLGQWWHATTGLPIPLGCIAAKRALGEAVIDAIDDVLARSVRNALADPDATLPYVRRHAAEMDPEILRKHIATFVNDHSLDIGEQGRAAVDRMAEMARAAGILP